MSTTVIQLPAERYKERKVNSFKFKLPLFNPFRKPAHFYIALESENNGDGSDIDNPMSLAAFLQNHVKSIRAIDSVYFKRNEIFAHDDILSLLKAKGTWIRAYGNGSAPVIKTKGAYIEVDDCSWF